METIGERMAADLAALRSLPAVPLEPCEKRAARVSSMIVSDNVLGREAIGRFGQQVSLRQLRSALHAF